MGVLDDRRAMNDRSREKPINENGQSRARSSRSFLNSNPNSAYKTLAIKLDNGRVDVPNSETSDCVGSFIWQPNDDLPPAPRRWASTPRTNLAMPIADLRGSNDNEAIKCDSVTGPNIELPHMERITGSSDKS